MCDFQLPLYETLISEQKESCACENREVWNMVGDFKERVLRDLTLTQKYIVVLLGANDFRPVKGSLWLQKELFALSKMFDDLREESGFEAYFLGPHSEFVQDELVDLVQAGVVEKDRGQDRLTALGKEVYKEISKGIKNEKVEAVSDIKDFLNDMTESELLGFVYFSYPEMRDESLKFKEVERKRKGIALSLLRRGKISVEKASEIAGISVERLIQESRRRGIRVYG